MQVYRLIVAVVVMVASGKFCPAAEPPKPVSVLDQLTVRDGRGQPEKSNGELRLGGRGMRAVNQVMTRDEFKTPCTITVRAKTDSTNIRLFFGQRGVVIFNWELNQKELRIHDPATGKITGIAGKGEVKKNEFVTVQWVIDAQHMSVLVDGEERAALDGNFANLSGKVGVGTMAGANVAVTEASITAAAAAPPAVAKAPDAAKPAVPAKAGEGSGASAKAAKSPAGSAVRPTTQPVSVMDQLARDVGRNAPDAAGLQIDGVAFTKTEYTSPISMVICAKTDSTNLRLYYGNGGMLIFNWELKGDELRYHSPTNAMPTGTPKQGAIPKDTFVTVEWIFNDKQARVLVDGVERAVYEGDYSKVVGRVGVGGGMGSKITVKSFDVYATSSATPATPSRPPIVVRPGTPAPRINTPPVKAEPVSIDVTVSTTPPVGASSVAAGATNLDAIERPEFQSKAKPLIKNVSSVTAMMIVTNRDGEMLGMTSDIIATVNPSSRGGKVAGAGFYRVDGDDTMKTAFQEAVRAVTLRYPYWEAGHIDFSFGEKFVGHGGPSAGTAFALLMLSTLEGFELDPKCAITGDITVDWKVRRVGGVPAKLRGAMLDKCTMAAIPMSNASATADAVVMYGPQAVYGTQVFAIETLQDAVAVCRKDRAVDLTEASRLFAGLQTKFTVDEAGTLRDPATLQTLRRVVALAPNHLSATQLIAVIDGTAPKTLSANATLYQAVITTIPMYTPLLEKKQLTREALPDHVVANARRKLTTLARIGHPDLRPLVTDFLALLDAMDAQLSGTGTRDGVDKAFQTVTTRIGTLGHDSEFMEKLMRDGY